MVPLKRLKIKQELINCDMFTKKNPFVSKHLLRKIGSIPLTGHFKLYNLIIYMYIYFI